MKDDKSVLTYHEELDRAARHGFPPTPEGLEAYRRDVERRRRARWEKRNPIQPGSGGRSTIDGPVIIIPRRK